MAQPRRSTPHRNIHTKRPLGEGNAMSTISPCYRHARTGWIASCEDCTAWHLATVSSRHGNDRREQHSSAVPPRHGDATPSLLCTPSRGLRAA